MGGYKSDCTIHRGSSHNVLTHDVLLLTFDIVLECFIIHLENCKLTVSIKTV